MRILFIPARVDTARFIPLGVASVAAYLEEQGHECAVFDEIPGCKPLEELLQTFSPDVVGVSCMTSTYVRACELAETVRELAPALPIIFGGIHPTSVPEETASQSFVDYVVVGEGELTMTELLSVIEANGDPEGVNGLAYKKNGEVVRTPPRGLIHRIDSLPMPARHLFDMDYYSQRWNWPRGYWLRTANMMSSRGCPFECIYCASKVMFGRKFRAKSVASTVDEIEHLVTEYGFECVSLSDDTFSINRKRALEICREIRRRDLDIKLRVQLRANTTWDDLVEELKKSGCIHIDIGVESGSQRILNILKKGITIEQVKNATAIIRRHGIRCGVTFIIGTPGELMEDVELTSSLAREIDADYTQFFIMTPYPGTELYQYASDHKLFSADFNFSDFKHGGADLKPFLNVSIPQDKLLDLQDSLNRQFMGKIVTNYFRQPKFLADLFRLFAREPRSMWDFMTSLLLTRSVGKSLKKILPHQI